jgi:pimeloyl-ACP methyl ester carboxylesterase
LTQFINHKYAFMKHLISGALLIAATIAIAFYPSPIYAGITGEKTKTITVDDAKIVYRVYGAKSGTPLVLLAPLGSALDDWDPAIIDGLTKFSTVVVFDNKGVGSSSGKTPTTIAEMAHDAISFIKAVGYSKVDLLGFSMGGFVGQQIVETEPQMVNKLILVGTGPQGSEGLSEISTKLSAAGKLSPEDQFLKGLFAPSDHSQQLGKASFARIQAKKEGRDLPISQETFVAELTAVIGWAQPDPDGFHRANAVANPVLIVGGQYDFFIAVSNQLKLYQAMPNSRLVLLPDAGHASFFQYPELFLQEAGYFLKN